MWVVVSHYVGNDGFFDRMLAIIFFENICWDKAMKHVLRFANCPLLGCTPFRSLGVESYGTRIIGLHNVYDVNGLSIMSMTMSRGSAGHR